MTSPRDRAAGLFQDAFRAVSHGGSFADTERLAVAQAVDALIEAVREEQPQPAGGPAAPQVTIGRLVGVARELADEDGCLNSPYLDGMLHLILAAAGLEPAPNAFQTSVEPTATLLRKRGDMDTRVTGRRLIELASPLVRLRRPPDYARGIVELICEALCLPADDYRAQVENAIREGLPWHGFLRPAAPPRPSDTGSGLLDVPPIRDMIEKARLSQGGQCENWAMGQAVLICDIAGLPRSHADRIAAMVTAVVPSYRTPCDCETDLPRSPVPRWKRMVSPDLPRMEPQS